MARFKIMSVIRLVQARGAQLAAVKGFFRGPEIVLQNAR